MKKHLILTVFLTFFLLCAPAPAGATAPKKLGKFGYWTAYVIPGAQPVCYMTLTAQPPIPKGSKLKRGPVTLMITHRPAEGSLDVVSYDAGTKFAPSSEVTLDAVGKSFNLFTQGDTAWARDATTDRAITGAIRAAEKITITGTASKGGAFADTIVMKGSAASYKAITEACGLSVSKVAPPAKTVGEPSKPKKPAAKTKEKPTSKK